MKKLTLIFILLILSTVACANFPYCPIPFPRDEAAHYDNIPYDYNTLIEGWYLNGKAVSDDNNNISYNIAMLYPAKRVFGYAVTKPIIHMQVVNINNQKSYGTATEYAVDSGNVSTTKLDITIGYKITSYFR